MSGATRQKGALIALLLTVFIDMVGFGIIIPFIPFWAEHFGAGPDVVTLLFATYSSVAFFFAFIWGWVSDRWGRKPVLILSIFGSVLSFVWLGLADALWMLFAARALGGLFGANISVAQAYIADLTPPEERAKGMGMIGAAIGLGFVLGPAIGGVLAGPDAANPDFRTPFFVAAGFSALAVALGMIFLKEPERHREPIAPGGMVDRFRGFATVIGHPAVARPLVVIVLVSFVMAGLEATFALWTERAHGWGPRQNGFFFAYIGVVLVLVQGGLVGPAVRRLGEARLAPLAVALFMVGIAMVPWSDTLRLVMISGLLIGLGFGLANPSLNGLVSRNTPADIQGAVLGASQSAQSLCRIFGPVTAGILFAVLGRDMPYHVGGAILLVAVVTAFRLKTPATNAG